MTQTSEARFNPAAVDLLTELRDNNCRSWFKANRNRVEELLLIPGRELVVAVGELLRARRPDIMAIPKVDHSIYRLNRDTRFSQDKTPYKNHLALWWWEGEDGRLVSPGFYFHLTPDSVGISVGCYRFSEVGLARWREAIMAPQMGQKFQALTDELKSQGILFSEPDLKRVPPGFDREHSLALWLRYKGFCTWSEEFPHPQEIFGPHCAAYLVSRFMVGIKLHEWLVRTLLGKPRERSTSGNF